MKKGDKGHLEASFNPALLICGGRLIVSRSTSARCPSQVNEAEGARLIKSKLGSCPRLKLQYG